MIDWLLKRAPVFVDISRTQTCLRKNGNPFNKANEKTHRYLVTIGVIVDFSERIKEVRMYKIVLSSSLILIDRSWAISSLISLNDEAVAL